MIVREASPTELTVCLEIRKEVFIDEQHVPRSEEIDGLDWQCAHFLAFRGETAIGTARLRPLADGDMKVERVAVRKASRGTGAGRALMEAIETEAYRRGAVNMHLSAQMGALKFYESLGWAAEGPVFDDAGIPHRKMHKRIG